MTSPPSEVWSHRPLVFNSLFGHHVLTLWNLAIDPTYSPLNLGRFALSSYLITIHMNAAVLRSRLYIQRVS